MVDPSAAQPSSPDIFILVLGVAMAIARGALHTNEYILGSEAGVSGERTDKGHALRAPTSAMHSEQLAGAHTLGARFGGAHSRHSLGARSPCTHLRRAHLRHMPRTSIRHIGFVDLGRSPPVPR